MYEDYFIVGVTTAKGNYTYHYHKDYWDIFKVKELPNAPAYDGHKPEDIDRLFTLIGQKREEEEEIEIEGEEDGS